MPAPAQDAALQALDRGTAEGQRMLQQAPELVQRIEEVLPLQTIVPFADLMLGGGMLLLVVILHGFLMRWVQTHVATRSKVLERQPVEWRADLVMALAVFALLAAVLVEMVLWTAAIKYAGLFQTWRGAAYYAANTYTTLGYGTKMLPEAWQMVGPIMAISGLFTFGWTGSVLVDVVGRLGRVKDLARQVRLAKAEARVASQEGIPPPAGGPGKAG
jgi:hypothetical protein